MNFLNRIGGNKIVTTTTRIVFSILRNRKIDEREKEREEREEREEIEKEKNLPKPTIKLNIMNPPSRISGNKIVTLTKRIFFSIFIKQKDRKKEREERERSEREREKPAKANH